MVNALGKIGPAAGDAVDDLEKLLEDEDPVTRIWVVISLVKIDPEAEPHVDVLISALGDKELGVRINAAGAVVIVGPRAKAAVPALIAALRNREFARHGARALGAIGPAAADAIKPLEQLARSRDADTAEAATKALAKIRE